MLDFEINSHNYKTSKIGVMTQWAVTRRIAPVIGGILTPELLKQVMTLIPKGPDSEGQTVVDMDKMLEIFSGVFHPFIEALAKMSDADSEFVINNCLAVVHRQQKVGGWQVVKPLGSGLMFEDIDMIEMMQLVLRVLIDNVGSFSFASLSKLLPPTVVQQ